MFFQLIHREILLTWRDLQSLFQPIIFLFLTISLFPLAQGADKNTLILTAPAALWIALLLANLLASSNIFIHDYQDGTLAQDIIHLENLYLLICAKLCIHWLRLSLPLLLLLPIISLLLQISLSHLPMIAALLFSGSLSLLAIGCIGSALTLSRQQNTFLLFLIAVPLYIPVLILGVNATKNTLLGLNTLGELSLLTALAIFSVLSSIALTILSLKSQPLP